MAIDVSAYLVIQEITAVLTLTNASLRLVQTVVMPLSLSSMTLLFLPPSFMIRTVTEKKDATNKTKQKTCHCDYVVTFNFTSEMKRRKGPDFEFVFFNDYFDLHRLALLFIIYQ